MDVYTKCSNYATDTCPCILAEKGKCIVCSMCRGEDHCTCVDTVSFCVLQELISNGEKAKKQHRSIPCEVMHVSRYDDVFRFIRIRVPQADMFRKLGAYFFARVDENPFFDVPISVLYEDYENGSIGMIIQITGIKTERFRDLKKGDYIYIRGPYYNGIQGRKAVALLHDSRAVVICRGIGFIPSLHVIGVLRRNNNAVDVYLDEGKFNKQVLRFFRDLQEISVNEVRLCSQNGDLTDAFDQIAAKAGHDGTELIHLGLSDHLLKKAIERIEHIDPTRRIDLSCINNAHICCGEGICGACTKNLGVDHTVRLCKEQSDLYDYKKLL